MNIKAIGFDYSGVIAGLPSTQFNQKICSVLGITLAEYQSTYFRLNYLLNENNLKPKEFWKKFCEEMNMPEKYNTVIDFLDSLSQHQIEVDMIELVDTLRAKGFLVGMLSNNTLETANQLRQNGIADHFDVMLISAEIGCSKPSPKAFELFIKELGVSVDELIFIDDTEKSLSTATEVGYHPILFTGYKDLVDILKEYGVL